MNGYFKVDLNDKQTIIDFLKDNNISYEFTKVLTDYLYDEDISYYIKNIPKNNNIQLSEHVKEEIKEYVFAKMQYFNWDNYDDYIVSKINDYLHELSD